MEIQIKEILEHIKYAKRRNSGVLIIEDEEMVDIIEYVLERHIAIIRQSREGD